MKKIKLTKGYETKVDDEDYPLLSKYKWKAYVAKSGQVYAFCSGAGQLGPMHRFLIKAKKGEVVDHKDRDGLNNRKNNLRIGTRVDNVHNSTKSRGQSKYRGVYLQTNRPDSQRWLSQITYNKKTYYLGRFATQEKAKEAYDNKRKELAGEFAPI